MIINGEKIMAHLNFDFYQGENEYSDGDVENDLLDIIKSGKAFDDVLRNDRRWPINYHLSHIRHNVLSWYPFAGGCDILEVGAGCGAITGLLCEKAGHVTAVELTKRRATINFERNKGYDNLDIYAGDIFKINFDRKFDYITSIGVLEYAAFMSKDKNPYADFLNRLKKMLKPGGHILIAIENRFGLKYFSGSKEDHTGKIFDGINGYPDNDRVRTFTKSEMEELLDSCDLCTYNFYYPYPDYKFPEYILTDKSMNQFSEKSSIGTMAHPEIALFDEMAVLKGLGADGVAANFANSFLVDVGGAESDFIMAKYSALRHQPYRISTIIYGHGDEKTACKVPLNDQSKIHVKQMYENFKKYKTINGFELDHCDLMADGSVTFKYISKTSLSNMIQDAIANHNAELVMRLIDQFHSILFNCNYVEPDEQKFESWFGSVKTTEKLSYAMPVNLDLNFDNIFIDDGKRLCIDYEWIAEFPVPLEYTFWRAVFFSKVINDAPGLTQNIFARYGISMDLQKVFYKWERNFSAKRIGGHSIGTEKKPLDMNGIVLGMDNGITSSVYKDTGSGFNENEREICYHVDDSKKSLILEFKLDNPNIKALRFDPAEGMMIKCKILDIKCDNGNLTATPANSFAKNAGYDLFLTKDPCYLISGSFSGAKTLTVKVAMTELDAGLISKEMDCLKTLKTEADKKISELSAQLAEQQKRLDSVLNSRSWHVTEPLRKAVETFKKKS